MDDLSLQFKFEKFCKVVLKNKASNIKRDLFRKKDVMGGRYDTVPLQDWAHPAVYDEYRIEAEIFHAGGTDIAIWDEALAAVLKSLTGKDQSILLLNIAGGRTERETAALLSMSPSTVNRRKTRAINAIRSKLEMCYDRKRI